MINRSTEIIKRLNRITNDRNVSLQARNQIREAIQHINDLHAGVERIRNLYFKLRDSRGDQSIQDRGNTAIEVGAE
jgi:hypothetical protein